MALPINLTTKTIQMSYWSFDANFIDGNIDFTLQTTLTDAAANTFIIPTTYTTQIEYGTWTIQLPVCDDPDVTPTGFKYLVTENFNGGRSYTISLSESDPATVLLTSKIPAFPTPTTTTQPVYYYGIWLPLQDRVTTLESTFGTYATSIPTLATSITNNTNSANSNINTAGTTLSPIQDLRLAPYLLLGGSTNANRI